MSQRCVCYQVANAMSAVPIRQVRFRMTPFRDHQDVIFVAGHILSFAPTAAPGFPCTPVPTVQLWMLSIAASRHAALSLDFIRPHVTSSECVVSRASASFSHIHPLDMWWPIPVALCTRCGLPVCMKELPDADSSCRWLQIPEATSIN